MARKTRRANRSIAIAGLEELRIMLEKLGDAVNDERVQKAFLNEAEILQAKMRSSVPVKTGNLKWGIVAKEFRSEFRYYGGLYKTAKLPGAFVGIDYRIAPHAHLVEFGTIHAAPHPFFRPAVRGFIRAFYRDIAGVLRERIESTARKAT